MDKKRGWGIMEAEVGMRNAEIKDEETLQRSGTEGGSGNAAFGFFELKALPSGL